jgi:SAM-dependent methyltransferase
MNTTGDHRVRATADVLDRIARFFDADYADYADDLQAIEMFAQKTGGPLLELGCGAGRLLTSLAEAGYRVTGVDLSPKMLQAAHAKIEALGAADRVTLVEGDYRDAALAGPYRFAFIVMNTFLHLLTQADQLAALRHWRKHLAPRSLLLIDVFHPDVAQLASLDGRLEWDKTWHDPATGATVMKLLSRTVDLAEQLLHVNLIYDEIFPDGQLKRTLAAFDLRYLWRYEAELLLEKAGFTLEAVYGDWGLGPFESASERMILLARARK